MTEGRAGDRRDRDDVSGAPDPRFLGGETAVLTDTSTMALVVAIGWKGECDLVVNVANGQAVEWLRAIADQIEARPSNVVPS